MSRASIAARLVLAAAGLASATPVRACSVCGCGDPLLTANDPAAITGGLRLQADVEYVRVDSGTDGRPGFTDQLTQWSYRLNAVFRPLEALSLTATVPFVKKTIHTVGFGTDVVTSDLEGLGDVEVGARYALWTSADLGARRVQELAVSAGASIPTGDHDARADGGALIDPHGQLGTGGWGPFAGLQYKFGDAVLGSVHAQYLPGSLMGASARARRGAA